MVLMLSNGNPQHVSSVWLQRFGGTCAHATGSKGSAKALSVKGMRDISMTHAAMLPITADCYFHFMVLLSG